MRAERVTEDEILAVLRRHGHQSPAGVAAVIIETDSSFKVLAERDGSDR
jgi:uncharacterized membrane protein YcaP (DUF421 family)